MTLTMFWFGGSGYSAPDTTCARDAEVYDSIASAKLAFAARTSDPFYPCVKHAAPENGGPEAWIFFGPHAEHPILGADNPDRLMLFGPRGGVIVTRS